MRILPAGVALFLLAGRGLAAETDPPPPIRRAFEKRSHERWGVVLLASGARLEGLVSTTPGKPLRVFDRKKSTYRDIRWDKIRTIEQVPDREWIEREWRWLEGGNDVKVYTGRCYRAAKYRTVLTLKTGEKIVGDVVAPVTVRTPKKRHRLELHKRFKSARPAKKKDLPPLDYIRTLTLTDRPLRPAEAK